jgi:hypothetical protein
MIIKRSQPPPSSSSSESDSSYKPINPTIYNQSSTIVDDLIDLSTRTPSNISIDPFRSVIIADDIEINQQTTPQLITIKIDPEEHKQPTRIQREDEDQQ